MNGKVEGEERRALVVEAGWGVGGGGVVGGGLHWFNATARAAVKRGLPFFPRPAPPETLLQPARVKSNF